MVRSIDPRRETLRAIQWQPSKPPYCLELMSRNPSWQRSCATASIDRTYDRKRSDPRAAPPLAGRGPSTYGLPRQAGNNTDRIGLLKPYQSRWLARISHLGANLFTTNMFSDMQATMYNIATTVARHHMPRCGGPVRDVAR